MSYNTDLENLIDTYLSPEDPIIKKRMFGGIAYFTSGNMCFGIYKDFLVLRVATEQAKYLLLKEGISPFDITGRPFAGWIMVEASHYLQEDSLHYYLDLSINFANSLPPK